MSATGSETRLHIARLGHFDALQHLSIYVEDNEPADNIPSADPSTSSFNMPALTTLALSYHTELGLCGFMVELFHGHFPSLTSLRLDLVGVDLRLPDDIIPACQALAPLFEDIGPHLLTLSLFAHYVYDAPRLLFPPLKRLRKLSLLMIDYDDSPAEFLPRSLIELECQLFLWDNDNTEPLMDCLNRIQSNAQLGSNLKVIRVVEVDQPKFSWLSVGESNPEIAGRLFTCALHLFARGIRLEDEEGACPVLLM
ncbi:hypothetical protein CALCODRAFT_498992 [Calocera cornea HHB12733]|uniref:F-box domain-containing protein n=1 Tax=Calocera cornea HHB12733 TaxID=1353952 RepID=A0A165EMN7_9BASI|nr:hypothetical protein CALCODRAFT_498992 [Calocera cornea HHB12733]